MRYKELKFHGKFDAILCLDAVLPDVGVFQRLEDVRIIAADGAALQLRERGIEPEFIIGDLDTLSKSPLSGSFTGSTMIRIKEQESNDFEKCLKYAYNNGWKSILITGFHGGELEHTLNNWSVFMRYARKMNLCIIDCERYGFRLADRIKFKPLHREVLSLVPQPRALLKTSGLVWELNKEFLEMGAREGIRNIAASGLVKISVLEGELLMFCESRLPLPPVIEF